MSELPQIPGERLVKALEKAGFYVKGQKGDHVVMVHQKDPAMRVKNDKKTRDWVGF